MHKFLISVITLLACIATTSNLIAQPTNNVERLDWGAGERVATILANDAAFEAESSFTAALWVRCQGLAKTYPTLASNKRWEGGKVVDLISEHNMGVTLASGVNQGWTIGIQPNGSWFWNLGNGKSRLDYLPTIDRQPICDGQWHLLAFTVDRQSNTARLFYDGKNVAIYSINGFNKLSSGQKAFVGGDRVEPRPAIEGFTGSIEDASIHDKALSDGNIFELYQVRFPDSKRDSLPAHVDDLKVLSWNIWHGARHPGKEKGIQQAVDFIKSTGADVIAMQETYGSGATIADRLGFYFYLRSSNLSVMSRYPIEQTHDLYEPFRFGGVTLRLSKKQQVNVFSLWIHYLPAWRRDAQAEGATAKTLIEGEWKTRAKELRDILKELKPFVDASNEVPLIVAGDFNSPSTLDWSDKTAEWHSGLTVDWPVSRQMLDTGFSDTYRAIHPDPTKHKTHELWNADANKLTNRIDYIYTRGKGIEPTDSIMMNTHHGTWPSDHPAVLSTLRLGDAQFGIISYNILEGFNNRAEENFPAGKERQTAVANWLADQAPAIVGFQELNGYTEARMQQEAHAWGHSYVATVKEGGYVVGLTSRHPIKVIERHLDGMHHGMLHCQTAGIDCFVVHLSPFKFAHRQREAAMVVERVKEAMKMGRSVIVLGDFNAVSPQDRDSYDGNEDLLKRLQASDDRHEHVQNLNGGKIDYSVITAFTDSGLVDLYAKHVATKSRPAKRRIDFILASPDLAKQSVDANWHVTDRHQQMSDHYPVSSRLRWISPNVDQ